MFKDSNYSLECDFSKLLLFINSSEEINRAISFNRYVKRNLYPLTENFLRNYYVTSDFSNLKKTFKNVNCAADVYSYFLQSYGYKTGSENGAAGASGANSSGLNPFFGVNADLGFNLGALSWLWLILLAAGIYIIKK